MFRSHLVVLIFSNALLRTVQLPHLRGSYEKISSGVDVKSHLSEEASVDAGGSFLFHQTEAHMMRPGKSAVLDNDTATCDASCALAALARPEASPVVRNDEMLIDFTHPDHVQNALAAEIDISLADNRGGFAEGRTKQIEEEISGLFASLPKNSHGGLGHAATNYAVHQWFVRRYQWYIRNDETKDDLSPGEARRAKVLQQLQSLIEEQRGNLGLGLRELASLVATIEHVLDGDLVERLKAHYVASGLSSEQDALDKVEVEKAILALAASVVSLRDRSGFGLSGNIASIDRSMIEKHYVGWKRIEETTRRQLSLKKAHGDRISFDDAVSVTRDVSKVFADILKDSCMDTKVGFAAMPNGSTGRVSITDMHTAALHGKYQFGESAKFLIEHEMVDETDKAGPLHVYVPNLLYGPSNCVGGTSFVEVCCPNECESLMEHIENGIRSPTASAATITSFVKSHYLQLKPMAPAVLERLEAIAAEHGGAVPLHGRHFAEWLNLAFPLECPMPHESDFTGKINSVEEVQRTERDFHATAKREMRASKEELKMDAFSSDDLKDPMISLGPDVKNAVVGGSSR
eukprot:TRINITY_DN71258_c0_g1_i1.p1 TRINITY_DN71258_c0_g1~~TRINITY_DN71258_c0_g1_i1.p1  ORF type:complete len:575 (-),score=112.95 TRINITY_DN71258_c0_g1_i1:125-1849(-)